MNEKSVHNVECIFMGAPKNVTFTCIRTRRWAHRSHDTGLATPHPL